MEDRASTTEYVTSRDGTRIGFVRRGSGPGVVLVQGAMGTAQHYHDLAQALSVRFTVYAPDRRGRGLSPRPYESGHTIARDVEDVDAILTTTHSTRVFGLSSGAMITLEAARTLDRVTHAAVFEPPFYPHGMSHAGIRQLNEEIERGAWASALVTALATAETAPRPIQMLPKPVARVIAAIVLWVDDWRTTNPYPKLRDLLPGIRYDMNVVGSMDRKMKSLASIRKPMLLLSGTESAPFLRESIRTLNDILPQAQHTEFQGVDHSGPWNADLGGHPNLVAAALDAFFA